MSLALASAGIGAGDEVIMPCFTFVASFESILAIGAKIVFIDIRPDTMNIDETKIEQAITKKTKAIVWFIMPELLVKWIQYYL